MPCFTVFPYINIWYDNYLNTTDTKKPTKTSIPQEKTIISETQENQTSITSQKGRKMKHKKKTSLDEDGYMGLYIGYKF